MLKRVTDVPPQIDALTALGTLTKEDYKQSVEPLFDDVRRSGRRIRLLVGRRAGRQGKSGDGGRSQSARAKCNVHFAIPHMSVAGDRRTTSR